MSESQAKMNKGPFDVDRTIPLQPVAADKFEEAVRKICALEPVIDAHIDRHGQLRIRYDASSVGIRDIERLLDESGVGRLSNAWWRFKSAWYGFLDDNAQPTPTPVEAHAVTGRLRRGAATVTCTGRIEPCPGIGHRILADVLHLAQATEIVLRHEECFDGSGYPRGLAGDDIPCRQGRGLAHVQHPIRSVAVALIDKYWQGLPSLQRVTG